MIYQKQVLERSEKMKEIQDKIKTDKKRISEIDAVMKNLNAYKKLKTIYEEYAAKNPLMKNSFYAKHKQEIDLFEKTADELKRYKNKSADRRA